MRNFADIQTPERSEYMPVSVALAMPLPANADDDSTARKIGESWKDDHGPRYTFLARLVRVAYYDTQRNMTK